MTGRLTAFNRYGRGRETLSAALEYDLVRSDAEKAASKAKADAKKQGPSTAQRRQGGPKGARILPKLRCPSRRSYCASPACSEPCGR